MAEILATGGRWTLQARVQQDCRLGSCRTPDLPAIDSEIWKALYLRGNLVGCHVGNSSDVTLAFEDSQAITPGLDYE